MHEADKNPERALAGFSPARSPRDVTWVLTVGLSPLLALALTVPPVAIMDHRGRFLSETLSNWNLYAVFGLVVFAPIMVVCSIGALVMISNFTAGRWISSMGSLAMCVCAAVLIYAGASDLVAPADNSAPAMVFAVTSLGTAAFVLPYLALLAADFYLLRRLWSRP